MVFDKGLLDTIMKINCLIFLTTKEWIRKDPKFVKGDSNIWKGIV
jgi:hypothetical protein